MNSWDSLKTRKYERFFKRLCFRLNLTNFQFWDKQNVNRRNFQLFIVSLKKKHYTSVFKVFSANVCRKIKCALHTTFTNSYIHWCKTIDWSMQHISIARIRLVQPICLYCIGFSYVACDSFIADKHILAQVSSPEYSNIASILQIKTGFCMYRMNLEFIFEWIPVKRNLQNVFSFYKYLFDAVWWRWTQFGSFRFSLCSVLIFFASLHGGSDGYWSKMRTYYLIYNNNFDRSQNRTYSVHIKGDSPP